MYYVGIDYHKRYSVASALDDAGHVVLERRLEHRAGRAVFQQFFAALPGPKQVVFETTPNWRWLYETLEQMGGIERIVMANAYQTRIIAAAQIKTDKLDARKLAWLLRADLIPAVHIPDAATRARKEVLRQRIFWVKQRTRIRNRIHQLVTRPPGVELPQVSDLFGKKGRAALTQARLREPEATLLRQNLAVLDALDAQIRQAEQQIRTAAQAEADVQWLESLPGVGLIIGSVMADEIDGVARFRAADRLCAYAGLVPTTSSSGDKTYHGRTLAACNKWLKWAFVEAAWVAVGCSAYFGAIYRQHRTRGKQANTAIMIVARRMCQIAWHLLHEQRDYVERPLKTFSPAALVTD